MTCISYLCVAANNSTSSFIPPIACDEGNPYFNLALEILSPIFNLFSLEQAFTLVRAEKAQQQSRAEGVSLFVWILGFCSSIMWWVYGYTIESLPNKVSAGASAVCALYVILTIVYYAKPKWKSVIFARHCVEWLAIILTPFFDCLSAVFKTLEKCCCFVFTPCCDCLAVLFTALEKCCCFACTPCVYCLLSIHAMLENCCSYLCNIGDKNVAYAVVEDVGVKFSDIQRVDTYKF